MSHSCIAEQCFVLLDAIFMLSTIQISHEVVLGCMKSDGSASPCLARSLDSEKPAPEILSF